MITAVLFSITVLFFLFLFIKPFFDRLPHVRICALCASVAITWLSMLFFHWFTSFPVDIVLLAILMGCSVVGLVYTLSLKDSTFHRPLFGLFFLLGGMTITYFLIMNIFDVWSLAILIPVFLLVYIFETSEREKLSLLGKRLKKQLERCCS